MILFAFHTRTRGSLVPDSTGSRIMLCAPCGIFLNFPSPAGRSWPLLIGEGVMRSDWMARWFGTCQLAEA